MKENKLINSYENYLKIEKQKKINIRLWQIFIVLFLLIMWELLARYGVIDVFLFSKPSDIAILFKEYLIQGKIFTHIGISLWETILGFTIGTILGVFIAILLWFSKTVARIFDPFLVVLNALPKTALAPILIIWAGAGIKGIVVIAITISLVGTILSAYNYFLNVDEEKIKMLESFGASKGQILRKLILPSNIGNIINIIKINIGMSWVGVIVGEFLVSRYGIGYLIVYGGQVFRLDLVMMGVVVLAICALIMYEILNTIEKIYRKKRNE
ncbi:ABC transporter permease [Clostridium fallax]|uniref:NitT/TauT family transport system permease protein n=1 Tax=Clostridium fallax TaxID=1533 RepID=A0A1M4Y6J1_9CLOT|nr:ABC transporter permease [Clostridium fallax]SHF01325.1 NitT/TauT family transport system permease protein [Clostridium fallax]SQB07455.1 ABC transporter permease protein [Clostridium fallax]